jgi:hypothetical protein
MQAPQALANVVTVFASARAAARTHLFRLQLS